MKLSCLRPTIMGPALVAAAAALPANAQNLILNGDFENNVGAGCQFNLTNAQFNAVMADANAFGGLSEICVMDDPGDCGWGSPPQSGTTKLGIASERTLADVDALSLALMSPTVAGRTYDLAFYAQAIIKDFSPDVGDIEIGLSNNPNAFGSLIFTGTPLSTGWTLLGGAIVAPVAASHLTIRTAGGGAAFDSWTHIDNFSLTQAPTGGCIFFDNKADFEAFNADTGKLLKGIETFEESNIPDFGKQPLPAPLQGNVPNVDPVTGFGFPNGLLEKNIIIQDNITPGPNPLTPNPSGSPIALYVLGFDPNFSNSKKVGEDLEVLAGQEASLDLIFTEPNHTGVGFDLSFFPGFGGNFWHITVYDKNDIEIGKAIVQGSIEPTKAFFGVWCESTIGRINIWDDGIVPDAIDNIQMWEEFQQPTCPWDCGVPHNKVIDVVDLLALLAQYDSQSPFNCTGGACDFNNDGCVDVVDLLKLLAQWGQACPPPPNDECVDKNVLDRFDPAATIVEHFDMYGATPSPEPFQCVGADVNPFKDIWYCLQNTSNSKKQVTITGTVDLFVEVTAGCTCPPGPVVACGLLLGATTFVLQPGEEVCIRLLNDLNLPNDLLKGDLIIINQPVQPPACPAGTRIDFGVTPDDFGNPNACPGPISITTQYLQTQSIVFGLAVDNFNPPDVVIVDDEACAPSCRSSGTPLFTGDWWCQFRISTGPTDPGVPAGVTDFSAELCFIDAPGLVMMEGYNNARQLIASASTSVADTEVLSITAPPGDLIAYVHIGNPARPAGVSVDCLSYPDPVPRPPDGANFFTDPANFFDELANTGKVEKFFWDFKPDNNVPPGTVVPISDPLDINTHMVNAPGVWSDAAGLDLWPPEVNNVQFASNINPQGPHDFAAGLEYHKISNNALVAEEILGGQSSFDIISGVPHPDNHTAFALELISLGGPTVPVFHVTVYDKQEVEIGKFLVSAPDQTFKVFLGIITKDNAITIGRIDIWDESGGAEGISSIAAFFRPVNPFGCPQPGDCCVPHATPGCDNEDCCRRVCSIDPFCCGAAQGSWDQICADEALMFPQCGCGPPLHDLEPCPPDGCPPPNIKEWCVYQVQTIVQDPLGECQLFGIFPGQILCVTPCPFPGDPVACQPDFPNPKVNFRVVGTQCVINCLSLDRCQSCDLGLKQWRRIN